MSTTPAPAMPALAMTRPSDPTAADPTVKIDVSR